jgi:hypothetical protein
MKAIVLLPVLALLFAGCKPSDSSTAGTGSSNSGSSNDSVLQAPANYVNGLGRAERNAGATADVASLNQAIGAFQIDKGRFPNNLDELVQEKYLTKVPDAPFGMKIDYDAATGQVKVVKQ